MKWTLKRDNLSNANIFAALLSSLSSATQISDVLLMERSIPVSVAFNEAQMPQISDRFGIF